MKTILLMFRAFKYRNFRLFFPGLILSQIGVWLQNIAISWLVYDMTKSAMTMGIVLFFNAIPLFALSPFAGVLVDKFDRKKLLLLVQLFYSLQAFLIAILTLSGHIQIWSIIVLGFFLNVVAAIDAPLRQSSFSLLVDDKQDLANAISLNSSCFNAARFIGPAIGGMLIAKYSVGICFLVNFICTIPNIILVQIMKIDDVKSEEVKESSILKGLKQGFTYAFKYPQIYISQIYIAVFSLLMLSYQLLLPIYTADVLHSKADILGYLIGTTGVGSLCMSLVLAAKTSVRFMQKILYIMTCISYILVGLTHNFYFSLIMMFFAGVGITSIITPQNVLIQNIVPDEIRGRILSINLICFTGTTSFSSYLSGFLTHHLKIGNTFVVLGITMLVLGTLLNLKLSKFNYSVKLTE